jgi:CHAD domain-containing protein
VAKSSPLYGAFKKRLDAFAQEFPNIDQGSVEAVHRTRVASRRLRELLPLLALDRETTRNLGRQLRKVTKRLGILRELDVLAPLIEELQPDSRYSSAALKQVSAAVACARDAARERLAAKLPTAKLERLADRLGRAARPCESDEARFRRPGASGPPRAWLWALEARRAHRAAHVQSAIEAAGTLYGPEHLHAVRVALKKLRYAAELSTEAGSRRLTADVAALKAAQDLLGRLHDLEVLLEWGRKVQASLSLPDRTTWRELGLLAHAIQNDCRQLHARYMHDRVRLIAIAHRMGAGSNVPAMVTGRCAAG